MDVRPVYVTDPNTGEETYYASVYKAAKAIGTYPRHVSVACRNGYKCRGFIVRYGEVTRAKTNANICFDCKKACGKCSWSGIDPVTRKPMFEPVPGWTAEKVLLNAGYTTVETYHITACPLFERDEPRKEDCRELSFLENRDFLANVGYLLKRCEDG